MIIINNGDCYMLETQTERFLQFSSPFLSPQIVEDGTSDADSIGSLEVDDPV